MTTLQFIDAHGEGWLLARAAHGVCDGLQLRARPCGAPMTTLSTPAEVAAWERAYDAAIAAGMQESAGTFADRKIVELRARQGGPERAPDIMPPCAKRGGNTAHAPTCGKIAPPVARERLGRKKLTDWLEMSVNGAYTSMVRDDPHDVRMRANDDGSWFVLDGDHRVIASGIATLGTFPTLLAAAQHAADSSAEARERYVWEGQEYPVCVDCDRPATHNEALIFAAGVGRDARWVHDPVCPRETIPAPTTPDHLADAGKKVAPTEFAGVAFTDDQLDEIGRVASRASDETYYRHERDLVRAALAGAMPGNPWQEYARAHARIIRPRAAVAPTAPTRAEVEAATKYICCLSCDEYYPESEALHDEQGRGKDECVKCGVEGSMGASFIGELALEVWEATHDSELASRVGAPTIDAVPTPVTDTLSPVNGTRAPDAVRAAGREMAGNRLVDAWDRLSNDLQSIEAHNEMEAAVSTAVAALIATK